MIDHAKDNAVKYLRDQYPEAMGMKFRMMPVEEFCKEDIIRMLMLNMRRTEKEINDLRASRDEWVKTAFEGARC